MGNTFTISAFLFQAEAEAEPEEGTNPPPPKRLRSDELTRVIVILPDGQRHQLDISRESTLMVSDVNKENKWSFLSPSICHEHNQPDVCTRSEYLACLMYPASFLFYWKVLMLKFNLPLLKGTPVYYMSPWSHL